MYRSNLVITISFLPIGSVYLWSACTSKVTKLCDLGADDTVTSISWATTGSNISVGTNSGMSL